MRILLTGGAGFIGSHSADLLLSAGHEVAIVDNLSTGRRSQVAAGAEFHKLDIRTGCTDVFESFRPDVMLHLAAQMDVRRSVREPDFDADVNIIGSVRLFENCVRFGVKRVVFASSGGAIYGEQLHFPAREDHQQYPVSPYGVSKLTAERYLHYYEVEYGLPYTALRYGNVYGPRQDPHGEAGVVAIFGGNLRDGKQSVIFGSGKQTRDYVYVRDVARANLLAVGHGGASGAYNIGTGVETSVNELYDILRVAAGSDVPADHEPGKPGEQMRSVIDPTKAGRDLGWEPATRLAEGIRMTVESLASQRIT